MPQRAVPSIGAILQVLYEAQLEGGETLGMQDALIQRLAEKDSQYYGQQISGTLTVAKSAAAGAIRDVKFLDTDTCFWQLTQQQTMQHKTSTTDLVPHLGEQSFQIQIVLLHWLLQHIQNKRTYAACACLCMLT